MNRHALIAALIALASCKQSSPGPQPAASASPVQPGAVAVTAAASAQPEWYVGKWTGTYRAEQQTIVMQRSEGMVQAWANDTGKDAAGAGTIELEVDADGLVRGRSEGPLGVLDASGTVDHDTLRVSLKPQAIEPSKAFHGFLIATHSGNSISGDLQASSGDSLVVRKATVALEKH